MNEITDVNIVEIIEKAIDRSKWEKFKFSDLFENVVEKVVPKNSGLEHYIGLEHLDSGSLHIKRFGDTSSLIGDKLKIYKGDIIFAKRNAYLKRASIAPFDAIASAHSLVLRPKEKNVLPEFIPFFLMSEKFWERAIEISVGSLSPTINWKSLAKQEFLLPPKDQQAQLAELLWAMDEVIEREKEVYKKNNNYTKSYIHNFFNSLSKQSKIALGKICTPKQWKTIPIKDLSDEGFLVYGGNGLIGRYNKYTHENSVIAIACRGEYCGSIHYTEPKSYVTGNSMCLDNLDLNIFNQKYLFYVLYYSNLNSIITGSAQPQIIKSDVERFKVSKVDMKVQEEVVLHMDLLWKNNEVIMSKIQSSQSLQKSLINQVF